MKQITKDILELEKEIEEISKESINI